MYAICVLKVSSGSDERVFCGISLIGLLRTASCWFSRSSGSGRSLRKRLLLNAEMFRWVGSLLLRLECRRFQLALSRPACSIRLKSYVPPTGRATVCSGRGYVCASRKILKLVSSAELPSGDSSCFLMSWQVCSWRASRDLSCVRVGKKDYEVFIYYTIPNRTHTLSIERGGSEWPCRESMRYGGGWQWKDGWQDGRSCIINSYPDYPRFEREFKNGCIERSFLSDFCMISQANLFYSIYNSIMQSVNAEINATNPTILIQVNQSGSVKRHQEIHPSKTHHQSLCSTSFNIFYLKKPLFNKDFSLFPLFVSPHQLPPLSPIPLPLTDRWHYMQDMLPAYNKKMRSSYVNQSNTFGHHNNTNFYFYSRYVTQGNNWSSYGLHQVEIKNETDNNLEVVGWKIKEGRVEEDFKTNVVRPGLFYTARLVPNSWGTYKSVLGALTVKVQGTNQAYTLAFEDPFHDYVNKGYKGHIQEGADADHAIASLKDSSPKSFPWGSYEFKEFDGRGKTVLTIKNLPQQQAPGRSYR